MNQEKSTARTEAPASISVRVAPGLIGTKDGGDSVKMMAYSREGVASCMKCDLEITEASRKYFNFHDACINCSVCGEEALVTYRDGPAETYCRSCESRRRDEERAAASAKERASVAAATELLLSAGGAREEREAAIEVLADYHYSLNDSW